MVLFCFPVLVVFKITSFYNPFCSINFFLTFYCTCTLDVLDICVTVLIKINLSFDVTSFKAKFNFINYCCQGEFLLGFI